MKTQKLAKKKIAILRTRKLPHISLIAATDLIRNSSLFSDVLFVSNP